EPAPLEPYAYGKAGVEVVIDHQDAPHEPSPSPRPTLNAPCLPSLPKRDDLPHDREAVLPCESVHYRISVANRRSVCPLQCIRSVPQPRAIGPEINARSGFPTRRAAVD